MSQKLVRLIGYLTLAILLVSACQSKINTGSTPVPPTVPLHPSDTPLPSTTPTTPPTASPTPTPPVAFADRGQNLGQGNGMCVVVSDVDGDGDSDALISTDDQASTLWLNDGMAEFTLSDQGFKASTCAALGDLNGDKSLDILFTEGTSNQVWLNDGTGKFRNSNQNLVSPESAGVALGDLDGDGDLDAFVVNWNGKPDQVFLNNGRGRFSDSGQKLGNWFGSSVALGDVDRDGDLDALVSNNGEASDNATVLWLNDGHGKFTDSQQRLGFTNASAVALGDLDGDGDLDAFIANSSHGGANPADKVWLNDGKGVFSDSGQSLGAAYGMAVALGDLDGDGDLDAFTGSWKEGPRVWLNDGKGKFVDSKVKLASPNSAGVAIADLDNDGDLDVFVATNTWTGGDGRHRFWLNQPKAPKASFDGVRVTFVGNAGFLITVGNKKILIDALFRGFKGDYMLPPNIQKALELGQPPFDGVDLILTTHSHADHFNADLARQHLRNDPQAIFASTSSVTARLTEFSDRIVTLEPTAGKSVQKDIQGIHVEALALSHGEGQPHNSGFVITVNGIKLFHTGDIDISQFSFDEFRAYQLPEKKIDLAFIQHFYLTAVPAEQKFVRDGIGGKYIIPIHYQYTVPPLSRKTVLLNYPAAIIFKQELQSWFMPHKQKNNMAGAN